MNLDLLRDLCQTPGVPGREERVRARIEQELEGLFDEVRVDAMGSLICTRRPRAAARGDRPTRVLLPCHMDEIGFYVRHIDDRGFVRVNPAGGFDARNLFARRVIISTQEGDIPAVMNPGGRPIHIASEEDKKKIPEIKEFFLDTGLAAEQVRERVRVGDMVTLDEPFRVMGEKVVSKALDNRIACFLGIEAVRALEASGAAHRCEIVVAFTVQEEVGLRGARTAAFAVDADIA
ncbi:MAG: M42 family peptidase, partial [Planctomycetota bacterium]